MKRAAFPLVVLPFLFAVACQGSSGDGSAPTEGSALDGPDVMVTAATEDIYTVGSYVGDEWETFGTVAAVAFDGEGNLYILDQGAHQVVVVGADGGFIRTVGKGGGGPGEFQRASRLAVLPDRRLAVFDFGMPGAFEVFDSEGRFLSSTPSELMLIGPGARLHPLPDGRLVAAGGTRMRLPFAGSSAEEPGDPAAQENRRPVEVITLDGEEPRILYAAWELPPEERENRQEMRLGAGSSRSVFMSVRGVRGFEPGLHLGVLSDGRIALADSTGYRVKLVALDGRVTGLLERPIPPLPVTESIQEGYRAQRVEGAGDGLRISVLGSNSNLPAEIGEMMEQQIREMTFADEVPVITDLAVDWEDRIWIARSAPEGLGDGPTDIVTADGGYVGTLAATGLRIPDAFGPGGLLAYIESDELDVQTVRVIRLVAFDG